MRILSPAGYAAIVNPDLTEATRLMPHGKHRAICQWRQVCFALRAVGEGHIYLKSAPSGNNAFYLYEVFIDSGHESHYSLQQLDFANLISRAWVAESVDAGGLKSPALEACGFESHPRH